MGWRKTYLENLFLVLSHLSVPLLLGLHSRMRSDVTRYATVALEKSLLFATKTGTLMSLLVGRIAEVLMYW